MTETKTSPLFRWLPSLTDVAFLLPLILLFAGLEGVRTMLGDGDTGWHLRIGEWILAHHQMTRWICSPSPSQEPRFCLGMAVGRVLRGAVPALGPGERWCWRACW